MCIKIILTNGIFTGKGIYDLKMFDEVLHKQIPENTVLSHDLLEGNYLRCGLASDILLLDSSPAKYISYMNRLARWTRGDWQIAVWLKKSSFNLISKFKILDNLRRSLVPTSVMLLIIFAISMWILDFFYMGRRGSVLYGTIISVGVISLIMPMILDLLNRIIFKKNIDSSAIAVYKNIVPTISGVRATIIRVLLEILFLPNKMHITLSGSVKAVYRMCVTRQKLLEWMTSEEAEKQSKTDLVSHFKFMWANVLIGIIFLGIASIGVIGVYERTIARQNNTCSNICVNYRKSLDISSNFSMVYK